jgi:hypothetical protein
MNGGVIAIVFSKNTGTHMKKGKFRDIYCISINIFETKFIG